MTVPFFTVLFFGIAIQERTTPPKPTVSTPSARSLTIQPMADSRTEVSHSTIAVPRNSEPASVTVGLKSQLSESTAPVIAAPVIAAPVEKKKVWHFANLAKPKVQDYDQWDTIVQRSPESKAMSTTPVAAKERKKSTAQQSSCLCQPTYSLRYSSGAVRYTSVAPRQSVSMAFVPNTKEADASEEDQPESIGMSDEEIRIRTSYAKAKNRMLARNNKVREQKYRRSAAPRVRRRKTLNLAQYKAILASKFGINRLVEHFNSSSSIAPFSMRHVGQYLGLGGGNLEGTGYSARSPYEALAVTSYAHLGLPVLYRGVAKGRDGYYAYQIYRK